MKNIGVITWFHYENYGTALQALVLQKYLANCNYKPVLIDFPVVESWNGTSQYYKRSLIERGKRIFLNKIVHSREKKALLTRSKRFQNVIYNNCDVSSKITSLKEYIDVCNDCDLIVCGSDQIWNPNWFSDYYYANYPQITTPKISYAASIGIETIPDYLAGTYFCVLHDFKSLSVREKRITYNKFRKFN